VPIYAPLALAVNTLAGREMKYSPKRTYAGGMGVEDGDAENITSVAMDAERVAVDDRDLLREAVDVKLPPPPPSPPSTKLSVAEDDSVVRNV
jgi:hypothetical protein